MKDFLKNDGFTLVEVLVSLTILMLVVIPLLSFFIQAYDYSSRNKNMGLATHIAQNTLIYMEKQDFDTMYSLATKTATDPSKLLHYKDDSIEKDFIKYSIEDCTYFPDQLSCEQIFKPTINSITYDDHVSIGLLPHDDADLDEYIIEIVVKVKSTREKEPDVFLKGVIVDETIR